ncbi:MAG TPA: NADPH-dependent glutamate synthase [Candidatus Gastranaerophilales bacterium]|nr:NADPH-dependent glutamate synthase [Candidatus Gastranaerophilales bacterium]
MIDNKKQRQKLQTLDPDYRNKNFEEVENNFSDEQALAEANRCIQCKNPKCVEGCPVNVQIPEFIKKIKEGNIEEAGKLIRQTNFLPSVCGRVCPQEHQCEGKCVLGIKGQPIAIGALERYVGDKTSSDIKAINPSGKKIAIIGSGCAGMSAAADLSKAGHKITVFEALHALGGVLRYGIPEFRLPRNVLDKEIDFLKKLGVEFKTNVIIGKSLTLKDLFDDGYKAVFISSGAGLPKMLNVPGENLNGVYSANEFLTRVNLMKAHRKDSPTPLKIGKRAVIIGGGNTAMDSARVSKRIGFEEVIIIYRRSEEELPARKAEIEHAKEEGVKFLMLHSPLEIIGDNKDVKSVKLQTMELGEPDNSGRRSPVPVEGKTVDLEVDTVIIALGTNPNPIIQRSMKEDNIDLKVDKRGYIIINPQTGETSLSGVWAGGDIAPSGESTAINAMGAGKKAAKAINKYLC